MSLNLDVERYHKPVLDLTTLSVNQLLLVDQLAGVTGDNFDSARRVILTLLQRDEMEFALVGTADEHLHATHNPAQHREYCDTCYNVCALGVS